MLEIDHSGCRLEMDNEPRNLGCDIRSHVRFVGATIFNCIKGHNLRRTKPSRMENWKFSRKKINIRQDTRE